MNEQELRSLPKVLPEDASKYLKGYADVSPQAIRIWAQHNTCPFCWAVPMPKRHVYVISVEMLIRFKKGELLCVSLAPHP